MRQRSQILAILCLIMQKVCALSDEIKEKPISDEDKKEEIGHIFGKMTTRSLDI